MISKHPSNNNNNEYNAYFKLSVATALVMTIGQNPLQYFDGIIKSSIMVGYNNFI
jgi:hypothetical protein